MKYIYLFIYLISPIALGQNLFNEHRYQSFIADNTAYKVGDILTILVVEDSKAKSRANLATDKNVDFNASVGYNQYNHEVRLGVDGQSKGGAATDRDGNIKASLSVRIVAITKDNQMVIEGAQVIKINGEIQHITVTGVVRKADIATDNTILSNRVADAHITYSGMGSVSNSQRQSLIQKTLSFLGFL